VRGDEMQWSSTIKWKTTMTISLESRYRGVLLGLVAGDALGTTYRRNPVRAMAAAIASSGRLQVRVAYCHH